jgi:Protein of unknown function (DUF3179)
VYDRRLNGKVLTFGHAGILYKKSFVMYDQGTASLWVHVTGTCEAGPLKGQQLTFMPSTVTTWEQWKAAHPNSQVLPGTRRGGFMGTYKGESRPAPFGLAVFANFEAKLYPFKKLKAREVVNDQFRDRDLTVAYFPDSNTAVAWDRRVKGRPLTFDWSDKRDEHGHLLLEDQETGSRWSAMTGTALSGELKGQQLTQLQYYPILIDRFYAFFPEADVFSPKPLER